MFRRVETVEFFCDQCGARIVDRGAMTGLYLEPRGRGVREHYDLHFHNQEEQAEWQKAHNPNPS